MNVNRVTLSAFGTTGVLLAASLTMLAMVSALVTFNAWPTRGGGPSASPVAVQQAPAARVVRAVRQNPTGPSAAARKRAAAGSAAARTRRAGLGGSGSGRPGGSGGNGGQGVGPVPHGSHQPPTHGGPGPPIEPPPQPAPQPTPVSQVTQTACTTIASVNGSAGATVCK